ncbi:MAG TPA: VWA domain-containing protein [Rhodanobacteraceae bacterium]|nr:VWA domain-containing protein [Rhodanobacteraceae bacterium]
MNRLRGLARIVAARRIGALVLAALVLLPVFLAPQRTLAGTTFAYLFVIDVSESMNVRDVDSDVPTTSRLDRAKAAVIAALAALPCGSRIAVGLFAGSDTLVLFEPLEVCRHYPAIEQVVDGIDWRMAWDGDSRVEAAVVNALHEAGNRGLDLVFLSDGDEAPHVAVPHMGELLALQGKVKGWLVGTGSPQASPVPRLDADNKVIGYWTAVDAVREGFYPNLSELVKQSDSPGELERSGALDEVQEHKSALNEEYLKQVGAASGLGYVKADSPARVASTISDAATARHEPAERDMRILFGLAAALLVMVGWLRKTEVGSQAHI